MERTDDFEQQCQDILTTITARGIQTISLQFTDISGHLKGVSIPADQLAIVLAHGQWIDGSSIEGIVRRHESDMVLRPDPTTFAILPWNESSGPVARIICDVYTMSGHPFAGDPRHVLRRALAFAAERGFIYQVAPEIEFFICQIDTAGHLLPLTADPDSYFDLSADPGTHLRHDLVAALRTMHIAVESSHHEVAMGQHEIDLAATHALHIADNIVTLKFLARHLARQHGLHITFMPKPFNNMSGSGLHIHQMLLSRDTGANLFAGQSYRTISALALHFIAGQIHHAPAFVAITNPLVNSYKRLAGGYEAPATITWAHENRAAFIRVPYVPIGHPEMTRVEMRGSDPAGNPYLTLAVLLRAGLAGIAEQLPAPDPVEEQVYAFTENEHPSLEAAWLPRSLGEALSAFSASPLLCEVLGEHVFGHFAEMKQREWRAYQAQVTEWEQRLSLEMA